MSKPANIDERLSEGQSESRLVRIYRLNGWDRREGYIVSVGSKWALLAMVDDRIRPDGFSAVRRRDISKIKFATKTERFVRRALEMDGDWPLRAPDTAINLNRTRGLISDLANRFPLISVFAEDQYPDACFIGRPQQYDDDSFYMREVTSNAEWYGPERRHWSRWRFAELTRLDAGGGYESALAKVAASPAD